MENPLTPTEDCSDYDNSGLNNGGENNYGEDDVSTTCTKAETVRCPICLEEVLPSKEQRRRLDLKNEVTYKLQTLTTLEACGHSLCSSCLSMYCASKVMDGETLIKCCYLDCSYFLDERDILQHLSEKIKRKYERYKFDAQHRNDARRCPVCDRATIFDMADDADAKCSPTKRSSVVITTDYDQDGIVSDFMDWNNDKNLDRGIQRTVPPFPPPATVVQAQTQAQSRNSLRPINPITRCVCGAEFCYYHSNAHPGQSCEAYRKQKNKENSVSLSYIQKTSKPCPGCGVYVQKASGCNQMVCAGCGLHFCWLCLAVVDEGTFPAHFQWWNLGGCPNLQMHDLTTATAQRDISTSGDADAPHVSRCALWCSRFLSGVQIVILGVPAFILSCLSCVLCACFVPTLGNSHRERAVHCFSFWGNCLTATAASPFICFGCLMTAILWIFQSIVKAIKKCCVSVCFNPNVKEDLGQALFLWQEALRRHSNDAASASTITTTTTAIKPTSAVKPSDINNDNEDDDDLSLHGLDQV